MLPIPYTSAFLKVLPWLLLAFLAYLYLGKRDDVINCEADKSYQNAAVLEQARLGQEAVKKQEAVDKVVAMFRVEHYKTIEQIKQMDFGHTCDEAAAKAIDVLITNNAIKS